MGGPSFMTSVIVRGLKSTGLAFGGGSGTPEAFFGPGGGNFGFGAALGSGVLLVMSFGHALSGGGGGFGNPFEVGRRGLYGGGNFTGGFSFALAGGPAVA